MPPKGTVPSDMTPPSGETLPEEQIPPNDNQQPPNNQPPVGGDPALVAAYNEQLLNQARENARLRAELERSRATPPAPPKELTPDEEKEFFERPVTTVRRLIKEEVDSSVEPLNRFTANISRNQTIEAIKQQMKGSPAQFPYISIPEIEQMVTQFLSNSPQIDAPTAVNMYNLAVGYHIANGGRLETPASSSNNAPPSSRGTSSVPPNPPHVRPTPPAPAAPSNAKKIRPLSEAEKKIARFNKMTDIEYLIWTEELSPQDVPNITDEELKKLVEKFGK